MSETPVVSVLLPAYNAARHIGAAIRSILTQSFADFELIVIDDGSGDDTAAVIQQFDDPRIRLLRNDANKGIVFSLNRGIDEARGFYIARMDADDIARPERLARQVAFMDAHPEVGLCGTAVRKFIPWGPHWVVQPPLDHAALAAHLLFANPLVHPSVLIRRAVIGKYALRYDSTFETAEDYRLWCEIALMTRVAVIPEVLLDYRVSLAGVTGEVFREKRRLKRRREVLAQIWQDYLTETLGFSPSSEQMAAHALFYEKKWRTMTPTECEQATAWLTRIMEANKSRRFFDEAALEAVCREAACSLQRVSLLDRVRRMVIPLRGGERV